ncbi:MAG: HAMP domain-containing protein [Zoogloeaceae bacterium]|jgi:nitrogen fixation/metabolism regulation signal transduction histidine kinase|nr:HAMP domain-containing protein [Zoogloeaceae bacterium]
MNLSLVFHPRLKRLLLVFGISGAILGAALGVILWFLLLASTSAESFLFTRQYPLLLGLNLLLAAILVGLVGWQVFALWQERRKDVFGSRLKLRLTLALGLMALLPGALVYGVSVRFITHSIESWFDVRVEKALEAGLNLGRSALDSLHQELAQKAEGMARELEYASATATQRLLLARLREQAGVDSVALFAPNGQLIASAQGDLSGLLPRFPSPAELKQARPGHVFTAIDGEEEEMRLRVLVALVPRTFYEQPQVLQLVHSVPQALSQNAESVEVVRRDYQELKLARQGLTQIYAFTLTLTVLLALFVAFSLAFLTARRLSAPLSILAAGTAAVAQGDYSPRETIRGHDELGMLTRSFNHMMRQLDEARQETERHRRDVESAHAYLESILANLSAGVLVFDRQGTLRTINAGAVAIVGERIAEALGKGTEDWEALQELGAFIAPHFHAEKNGIWQGELALEAADGNAAKTLLLRGTRLPEESGGGSVVVFDDVTRLIAAQRSAAWGEVARRLTHEIKNPLTPIQLCAERLQVKLCEHLQGREREMLERSTQTIINQVQAMKRMVDDFRDYSRHPAPELSRLDLNALIRDVLCLYEHSSIVKPIPDLDETLPPVLGDANQIRQVIHNLLRNGEDALENISEPRLFISTRKMEDTASLRIADNGPGFPAAILPRVLEPYVTTKAKGSGLGLPIVKKIIDEHQGSIDIGNQPEGGACIRIRLPLAHEETEEGED